MDPPSKGFSPDTLASSRDILVNVSFLFVLLGLGSSCNNSSDILVNVSFLFVLLGSSCSNSNVAMATLIRCWHVLFTNRCIWTGRVGYKMKEKLLEEKCLCVMKFHVPDRLHCLQTNLFSYKGFNKGREIGAQTYTCNCSFKNNVMLRIYNSNDL